MIKEGDKIELNYIYVDIDSAENKFGVEPQCSWLDIEMYLDTEIFDVVCNNKGVLGIIKKLSTHHQTEDDFNRICNVIDRLQADYNGCVWDKMQAKVMTKFIPLSEIYQVNYVDVMYYKEEYCSDYESLLLENDMNEQDLLNHLNKIILYL